MVYKKAVRFYVVLDRCNLRLCAFSYHVQSSRICLYWFAYLLGYVLRVKRMEQENKSTSLDCSRILNTENPPSITLAGFINVHFLEQKT